MRIRIEHVVIVVLHHLHHRGLPPCLGWLSCSRSSLLQVQAPFIATSSPLLFLSGVGALLSTRTYLHGLLERAFASNASSLLFPIMISTIPVSLCIWVGCYVHCHCTLRQLQSHPPCRSCPSMHPFCCYCCRRCCSRRSMTAQSIIIRPYPTRWHA